MRTLREEQWPSHHERDRSCSVLCAPSLVPPAYMGRLGEPYQAASLLQAVHALCLLQVATTMVILQRWFAVGFVERSFVSPAVCTASEVVAWLSEQCLINHVPSNLTLQEDIEAALGTYHLMSERWFTHASPTLFNAGTPHPQLSSCFLICMKVSSSSRLCSMQLTTTGCAGLVRSLICISQAVHREQCEPACAVWTLTTAVAAQGWTGVGYTGCHLELTQWTFDA